MLSLFSTSSDKAGLRLQYMEVYNWGTFNQRIFRINPEGNNSLLTGANASGKSTYIDALLTLLVPVKRDRFYNQSSGVDKKGDRTEETYVLGHYGNIQREGEYTTSTQALRDKGTYSVILASFSDTDQRNITIFQVRWFSNGELKRAFGVAHIPLEIEKDFKDFDGKGHWKKRLDKIYNSKTSKKRVEFLDGPTSYAERIAFLFGMRSTKALSLFNQVVGVKVLEDLNEFVRNNMLEEQDAEAEFIQLKESFLTLMDAKTNIEKAKEQIGQLTPINDLANKLNKIQLALVEFEESKDLIAYWFAKKGVELGRIELEKCQANLQHLKDGLKELKTKEESLKREERSISISIEKDEVGNKIKELEKDIKGLERLRDSRSAKLDNYNKLAKSIELNTNPSEETFLTNRENASVSKAKLEDNRLEVDEQLRLAKNNLDVINNQIYAAVETIKSLKRNENNIAGRVAEIREEILKNIGASKEEVPFIGELVKVREEESEWELALEKILHNFALRLIVPEKFYSKVNDYVNRTNLKGRIIYQRFRGFTSLGNMSSSKNSENALINKLEFRTKSPYTDWIEDIITNQYNYACVQDLKDFNLYEEKAITKEGLIKFAKGKHEKDDRPHTFRKDNFVLGWDNKYKIKLLQNEVKDLQEKEKTALKDIREIKKQIKSIESKKEAYTELFKVFAKYDDIDWKTYAEQIQEKEREKSALEKTNDRVQALQRQLKVVQDKLSHLTEIEMDGKKREIYQTDQKSEVITNNLTSNKELLSQLGEIDVTNIENQYPELLEIKYAELDSRRIRLQDDISHKTADLNRQKQQNEREVILKINAFKRPSEVILDKFKDWGSDVSSLPESTNLDLISEYQKLLKELETDNLPRFEKKWNELLQTTITDKIGSFRIFFTDSSEVIKSNINHLNASLKEIDFKTNPTTYIQIVATNKRNEEVLEFRNMLDKAIPNIRELDSIIDGRKHHFVNNIEPLINKLDDSDWRRRVMEVRSWYTYKAEEFYKETNVKFKTYENMGALSGGQKAQLTYTILGSAIAYQFGLANANQGLESNSFRFIAIDEAFKAQDEEKAKYLLTLCKQLHLQLLVVTPLNDLHIVEDNISYVHYVEIKEEKYSWLYDMPIEQFKVEKANFVNQ
jgi:uncharacterized protein YPO0396